MGKFCFIMYNDLMEEAILQQGKDVWISDGE